MAGILSSLIVAGVVLLAFGAAVIDGRTGRIPNWLTLPSMGFGLVVNGIAHGPGGAGLSLFGLILCALVPWLLFQRSGGQAIGGGDVKLVAAIGALTGPTLGLEIEFMALLALVFLALVRLTYRGKLGRVLLNVVVLLTNPLRSPARRKEIAPENLSEMRLGPGVALGVFVVLFGEHLARWLPWLA
jgi:prepilin peptidase CpaA